MSCCNPDGGFGKYSTNFPLAGAVILDDIEFEMLIWLNEIKFYFTHRFKAAR